MWFLSINYINVTPFEIIIKPINDKTIKAIKMKGNLTMLLFKFLFFNSKKSKIPDKTAGIIALPIAFPTRKDCAKLFDTIVT